MRGYARTTLVFLQWLTGRAVTRALAQLDKRVIAAVERPLTAALQFRTAIVNHDACRLNEPLAETPEAAAAFFPLRYRDRREVEARLVAVHGAERATLELGERDWMHLRRRRAVRPLRPMPREGRPSGDS